MKSWPGMDRRVDLQGALKTVRPWRLFYGVFEVESHSMSETYMLDDPLTALERKGHDCLCPFCYLGQSSTAILRICSFG